MLLTKMILLVVMVLGQESPEGASSPATSTSSPSVETTEKPSQPKVPQRIREMEGTFKGVWTSYKYEDGKTVERASWTDTLVCDNLRVIGEKAVIDFASESIFKEESVTRSRSWREGYFLIDTGGLGDRYVEYFDTLIRLKQVSDTTWTYVIPMVEGEFGQMGFENAIRGEHIVIMTEQKESGVDTRRLTRVTSIVHKDDEGNETTTQFLSLQGYHKRAS